MAAARTSVLVTGAAGYIASRWLQDGTVASSLRYLVRDGSQLPEGARGEVEYGSIPDIDPETLLADSSCVVHLASRIPTGSGEESMQELLQHEAWTERLARACIARNAAFLFVSTSAVYSAEGGILLAEDTSYVQPQNPYAASKLRTEDMLRTLTQEGLRVTILRLGSVFGLAPRMHFRTLNLFAQQASLGKPLSVWERGITALKPYTYVGDVARAFNFILEHDLFNGDVYNVVTENRTTEDCIAILTSIVPGVTTVLTTHERMSDLSYGMDDRALRALGFVPQGSIAGGFEEMIHAFQPHHKPAA